MYELTDIYSLSIRWLILNYSVTISLELNASFAFSRCFDEMLSPECPLKFFSVIPFPTWPILCKPSKETHYFSGGENWLFSLRVSCILVVQYYELHSSHGWNRSSHNNHNEISVFGVHRQFLVPHIYDTSGKYRRNIHLSQEILLFPTALENDQSTILHEAMYWSSLTHLPFL